MKETERVKWKNYFLGQKYKMYIQLGYTKKEIINKYKKDYVEHEAHLHMWVGTENEAKKRDLMFGLLKAISQLEKEILEKQLTFL